MFTLIKNITFFIPFFFACSHAQLLGFTKLKDMTCEELTKASNSKDFALNSLAGIRGVKKCPGFAYDIKSIPEFDRKLYAQEISEAVVAQQKKSEPLTINTLHKQIHKEKKLIEKISLLKQLRLMYRANNNKNESFKTLKEIYNLSARAFKENKSISKTQDLYLESALSYGRSLYSQSELKTAETILSKTYTQLKSKPINLTELTYLLGKVKEDSLKFLEAVNFYDTTLNTLTSNSLLTRDKVLWTKAWTLYKSEDWIKTTETLKQLINETSDVAEKSRARFFLARALNHSGNSIEAKKVLTELSKEDFYSYYSLLSYEELSLKLPAFSTLKSTDSFNFNKSLSFLSASQKELFNELIKNDEIDLAEKSILYLAQNQDQSTQLGLELARLGQRFLPLFISFAKLPLDQKQDLLVKNHELIFPRLWENEVNEMASTTGLPKSLIFSIMRQESAFNINSRSHANAMGLMQVIPPLAKQLARKFKVNYKNPEDLFNPQINIKLGSLELSEQVKRQNQQFALVAAAYNAGPNAVKRWLKTRVRPKFDVVDFIEEIPYDETRLYVKIIARNYLFYDRLENPSKETTFPKQFIKNTFIN